MGGLWNSVVRPGLLGIGERDVTDQAVALAGDPRIVRLDRDGAAVPSPGGPLIGSTAAARWVSVTVTEQPAGPNLDHPPSVELSGNHRSPALGHYPGKYTVDLSNLAEWAPSGDQVVYVGLGLLEGLARGRTPWSLSAGP